MEKSNTYQIKELKNILKYFKERNKLSAFPLIDTGYISDLEQIIINNNVDYDSDPVVCCAHCKKLSIKIDDNNNDICILCNNAINEVEHHATIFHYLNKYPNRWEV